MIAVRTMEPQLPIFKAFCTAFVLNPALSDIRTNKVPIIDNTIPVPAMSIGKSIGAKPLKLSTETVSCPKTIVASTVAT